MGRRGPRAAPTALKKLRGNPGKRALPKKEPAPTTDGVAPPPWLSAEARAEWDRVAPELQRLGLLTLVDVAALAGYCTAYANWQLHEQRATEIGTELAIATGVRNAALRERQQMRQFAAEFGGTPSARARVHGAPTQDEDPFAEFSGLKGIDGGRKG